MNVENTNAVENENNGTDLETTEGQPTDTGTATAVAEAEPSNEEIVASRVEIKLGKRCSPDRILAIEDDNVRWSHHTDESVEWLVQKMLAEGNRTPVEVVPIKDPNYDYKLVSGYGRHRAASLIVKRGLDPNFELNLSISKLTEQQILIRNITENTDRTGYSAMDQLKAATRLRDLYGFNPTQVGRVMKKAPQWITGLYLLEPLSEEDKKIVDKATRIGSGEQTSGKKRADGGMSVSAAIAAMSLPEEERKELFKKAKAGQRVTQTDVVKKHREAQASGKTNKKAPTMKTSEILEFLAKMTAPVEHPAMQFLFKGIVQVVQSSMSEADFGKKIHKVFERTWLIPSDEEGTPIASVKEIVGFTNDKSRNKDHANAG